VSTINFNKKEDDIISIMIEVKTFLNFFMILFSHHSSFIFLSNISESISHKKFFNNFIKFILAINL